MTRRAGAEGHEHMPLSPAQRSIWFLDKSGSGGSYNIARARMLKGPLDVALLAEAQRFVVDRHEILRTRYVEVDGVPTQVVDPPGRADFAVVEVGEDLESWLGQEADKSFDLSADPMWRCRVIPIGPENHVLLDVVHHIAADGWSIPQMRAEAGAYYNASKENRAHDLAPAVQYREITRERQRDELAADLAYWESALAGAPDTISLPTDRPAGPVRSTAGTWAKTMVPGIAADELEQLAGDLGASPSMIGLSLFAASLARYAGTSEMVIGVPVTGRTDPSAEGVIGPFFNSLPIRLRIDPEMSLRQLVSRTRQQVLDAMEHEVPFDEIVRAIDPPRVPGQTPIFQVMFQHRDAAFREGYGLVGITEESIELAGTSAKFDLLLEMAQDENGIEMSLNSSRDMYDEATTARLVEGFAEHTRQALAVPDQPLGACSMLSAVGQSRITRLLADNQRPLPTVETLADHYEKQVAGRGSDLALTGRLDVTHEALLAASAGIEAQLLERGVSAGSVVALTCERSPVMVAALLAINRLGAVYVPIDPEYPEERIRRILEISGAAVRVSPGDGPTWAEVVIDDVAGPHHTHDPSSRAVYVMFTSGSTGDPKGVVIGEDAVLRLVCDPDYVSLGPGDVVAHLSNVAFDAATFEIWGPLLNGATMAIIDRETVLSPPGLEAELERLSVTTIFVTTALFNLLARHRPALFEGVRDVMFGGERCDPTAVRRVIAAGPPSRLLHVYGPTETTTFASWYEIPLERPISDSVPIGRPIANTRLYVLDAWGGPIPQGLVGELFIGGPGVAIGYAGDPVETEKRFSPDPFSDDPWGRMYRTGDRVRVTEEGFVDFLGRADRQVKLRGFRIELGEIETTLRSHPSVNDAVVRLVESDDRRLIAWVATDDPELSEPVLKDYIGSLLPGFMIPTAVLPVDEIPIGATGKIDASRLPAVVGQPGPSEPVGETEARVIGLFEEVLGVSGVARSDDFFDLGGHSIRAVELVALIEKRLGRRIGVMEMIEGPTPLDIAARLDAGDVGVLERRLVEMAPGHGDPLFVFHHPSGTVQAYSDLVKSLPDGVRVVGVNASGVDGTIQPSEDLLEMAEDYASLIASAHDGPFQLIGHSLGGLLAWETARQLIEAGHEVDFLGLIDTQLPQDLGLSAFMAGLPGSIVAFTRAGYRRLRSVAGDVRWGSKRLWYQLRDRPLPADVARIGLVRASSKSFDSYQPRPVDIDVVYFLATGSDASGGRVQPGWSRLTSSIEIVSVPGMHTGPNSILVPPNVSHLAREVAVRLPSAAMPTATTVGDSG